MKSLSRSKAKDDPVVHLLKDLEWRYPPRDKDWTGPSRCPVCFAEYPGPHQPECELRDVLAAALAFGAPISVKGK
jgi:hypothetical protein